MKAFSHGGKFCENCGGIIRKYDEGGEVDFGCKNPDCDSYGEDHPNCQCYAQGGEVKLDTSKAKLLKEDSNSYLMHHPQLGQFQIAKDGLDSDTHEMIKGFADGGESESDGHPMSGGDQNPLASMGIGSNQADASLPPTDQATGEVTGGIPVSGQSVSDQLNTALNGPTKETPKATEKAKTPEEQLDALYKQIYTTGEQAARGTKEVTEQAAASSEKTLDTLNSVLKEQARQRNIYLNGDPAHGIQGWNQRDQELSQAVANGKIDPNNYWNNLSNSNKVTAGLGIFLGGIGQGILRSGSNPAMDVINKAIDNDIVAQKATMEKNKNLYSMHLDRLKNHDAADLATRNDLITATKFKLQSIASKMQGGLANPAYLKTLSTLDSMKANYLLGLSSFGGPNGEGVNDSGIGPEGIRSGGLSSAGESEQDRLDREKSVSNGQAFNESPHRYGFGLDNGRVAALTLGGVLKGSEATDIDKESGQYQQLQKDLKTFDDSFNVMSRNATIRGRIARHIDPKALAVAGGGIGGLIGAPGGIPGAAIGAVKGASIAGGAAEGIKHMIALGDSADKDYEATKSAMTKEMSQETKSRPNPFSADQFEALLPEQGDGPSVQATKRALGRNMIKRNYTFPVLEKRGIIRKSDPILHQDKFSEKGE